MSERRYLPMLDGSMAIVIEASEDDDGMSFTAAKREVLKYLRRRRDEYRFQIRYVTRMKKEDAL